MGKENNDVVLSPSLQILLNLSCNLDCTYCYENKKNIANDYDNMVNFIDYFFKNVNDANNITVEFIGGEVFLEVDLMERVLEYVVNKADKENKTIDVSISSNGTLFTTTKSKKFIEKYKDILFIGVSIDGIKEVHDKYRIYKGSRKGSFDDVVNGIKYLQTVLRDDHYSVKATYTKETWKHFYESMRFIVEDLKMKRFFGNIIFEDQCTIDDTHFILDQLLKFIDFFVDEGWYKRVYEWSHFYYPAQQDKQLVVSMGEEKIVTNQKLMHKRRDDNWCGTIKYMKTIGFNNKIYGCNRWMTMDKKNTEIGYMDGQEFVPLHEEFQDLVLRSGKIVPDECKNCKFIEDCPTCIAGTFEAIDKDDILEITEEDIRKEKDKKVQCGFTWAKQIAKSYLFSKIMLKEGGAI